MNFRDFFLGVWSPAKRIPVPIERRLFARVFDFFFFPVQAAVKEKQNTQAQPGPLQSRNDLGRNNF